MPAAREIQVAARLIAVAAFLLAGCSSAPKTKEPTTLQVELFAEPDLNPDINGRPSPVQIQLCSLRRSDAFMSADYFMLADHNKEALGDDLVQCESLIMEPGDFEVRSLELEDDARALAVLVGYRDLGGSVWKQAVTLPPQVEEQSMFFKFLYGPHSSLRYQVHLDSQQVYISASDEELL